MPPRAYFRVDADARIGSGHLVRCRLLAEALEEHGVDSRFLVTSTPAALEQALAAEGRPVARLTADQAVDPHFLAGAIRGGGDRSALLVVDSDTPKYHAAQWHETIRAHGIRLMIITFRHDCHFAADIVLNQNLLALHRRYSAEKYTEMLLGPRYAILAEAYRRLHEAPLRKRDLPRTLILTFGGADRHDLTARAVRAVARLRARPARLIVVAGSLYAGLAPLRALLAEHADMNPELHVDTRRMHALMAESDLALSSGGLTAWELACVGVPNVIVSSSDPERQTAELLEQEGLACFAGHHDAATEAAIADALERLAADPGRLAALAAAGRRLVDGRGRERVIDRMLAQLRRPA
jgi:UDP-2,4-diacetamido-2,4,6-trideoxy-beta-L-altropyranose hydrolase